MQGSLINNLASRSKSPTPEVGMGVTFLHWTDRSAGTIVEVRTDRKIVVQYDKAVRVDQNGMSESQSYEFHRLPESRRVVITKRKNGQWKVAKEGTNVAIGYRDYYHDYSF